MGGILSTAFVLLIFYFIFNLIAQFLPGQLILVAGSIAFGVGARNVCLDFKERPNRKFLLAAIAAAPILLICYYFAITSKAACDGYYLGKIFGGSGGVTQSGADISFENYSSVCHWPGFRYACKQYDECRQGIAALRALPLFLFGLICISIGSVIGLLQVARKPLQAIRHKEEFRSELTQAPKISQVQFDLLSYANENPEKFLNSTVKELSLLSTKSERSIKSFITKNRLRCADYESKRVG